MDVAHNYQFLYAVFQLQVTVCRCSRNNTWCTALQNLTDMTQADDDESSSSDSEDWEQKF